MAIPLFDTATLQAPLHKAIQQRVGEVGARLDILADHGSAA